MGYGFSNTVKDLKNRFADKLMELRNLPYLVKVRYISKTKGYVLEIYDPISTKLRDNHRLIYSYKIIDYTDITNINLEFDDIVSNIILKDNIERFMKDDF